MKIIVLVAVVGIGLLAAGLFYTYTHGHDTSTAYMPRRPGQVVHVTGEAEIRANELARQHGEAIHNGNDWI